MKKRDALTRENANWVGIFATSPSTWRGVGGDLTLPSPRTSDKERGRGGRLTGRTNRKNARPGTEASREPITQKIKGRSTGEE